MTNTLSDPSNNCQPAYDESSLFIVIHADIVYDKELSSEALRVYLIISGFFRKSGYAFASNEWIAEKTGYEERTIQRYLQELENKKYIIREVFNVGFKKQRRIWHPDAWAKKNSKNVAQSVTPDVIDYVHSDAIDYVSPDVYNNISNINNNIYTPSPSSFANAHYEGSSPKGEKRPPPNKKIERKPNVKTTEEEHAHLVKDFGAEMVEACYSHLSDWKANTPKSKWKLHDNLSIRKWVVDAVKEKALKAKPTSAMANNHQERAKKMHEKYPHSTDLGPDYFVSTTGAACYGGKFGSPECESYLKKYGF